ncbi:MAG: hypothetical protein RIR26_2215, partial [Pseudomonadota bacterium]
MWVGARSEFFVLRSAQREFVNNSSFNCVFTETGRRLRSVWFCRASPKVFSQTNLSTVFAGPKGLKGDGIGTPFSQRRLDQIKFETW